MTLKDRLPKEIARREALQAIKDMALVGGGIVIGFLLNESASNPEPVSTPEQIPPPQGFWEVVSIKGTQLHVEVNAYHDHIRRGIERVFVTLQDQHGHWIPICALDIPARTNTFECDVDIAEYIGGREIVPLSFNVVATDGQLSEAPSSGHPLRVNDNSENQIVR